MNAFDDAECSLQISFSLVCGLCWGCSLAATCLNLRSLLWSRRIFWRCLSFRRLPFWILFRPLDLTPPLVRIHCQGEYEVGVDVPVLTGRRPEVYRHLRPLQQTLGKLLLLVLQHGCRGLPLEMRKSDLMKGVPSRRPVPHSMEPETSEPEGSQGFASSFHGLLGCHIQEDGMWCCNWYHVAHLQDSDQYEAGGIQLVCQIHTGACSMPHMQMHVGGAEGLHGNIVRLIHELHSHVRRVLPIEHTFSHGQHQGLLRCHGCGSLHQVGTLWLREPFQEASQWYSVQHQLLKGLGEA